MIKPIKPNEIDLMVGDPNGMRDLMEEYIEEQKNVCPGCGGEDTRFPHLGPYRYTMRGCPKCRGTGKMEAPHE